MDAAGWGLIGTLVGAAASIGTTWIANTFSFRMHSDKQQEERREKAKEFQRATLLDLQEALHDGVRMRARLLHELTLAFSESGVWGNCVVPDEVDEGQRLANRKLSILNERVENADLRNDVKAFRTVMAKDLFTDDKDAAVRRHMEVMEMFMPLLEKLGAVLRSYY